MVTLERRLQGVVERTGREVKVAASVLAIALLVTSMGLFGLAPTLQVLVTLLIPVGVVTWFWLEARSRIREAERSALVSRSRVPEAIDQARAELIAGAAHELVLHPERCSLRAETLAVAVDYRVVKPGLKVAVPDLIMVTDPHLFRFLLHTLVANAVEHGGPRIAIWAESDESSVWLAVSDDGPGVPEELEPALMKRTVDLASGSRSAESASGLSVARTIGETLGGKLGYRRDARWTHFSIRLPLGVEMERPTDPSHWPMEARVI